GVSGNKSLALRDLARRERDGEIPSLRRLAFMDEEAIVQALIPVRGIGRWTVEMMLMFRLGRPDLLPVDDLGVRKGAQRVDRQERMPTPKEL
ncbi:MAG: DNA-3-methyladenine glycosylase 2 family protein, partial [Xanthomonas perforans]|nr:DNA-3-methyladenine glycosylase 2 family protein [Xanthomonas perforans]